MRFQNNILLETQFFPTIACFYRLIQYPTVILEKHEYFQKTSYRNRCHIATAQGIQTLSVPLKKGKNQQQIISEVQISNDVNWQRAHSKTLQTAYGNAPYWEHYASVFETFFTKKYNFLFDYNTEILQTFLKILKLDKSITLSFTNAYQSVYTEGDDLRNKFSLKNDAEPFPFRYPQIFEDRQGFIPNLCMLDLIFCCGKQSLDILKKQ